MFSKIEKEVKKKKMQGRWENTTEKKEIKSTQIEE